MTPTPNPVYPLIAWWWAGYLLPWAILAAISIEQRSSAQIIPFRRRT